MPTQIIEWTKECDNCGEIINHIGLDMTQEQEDRVILDIDFLSCMETDFYCRKCGTHHYTGEIDIMVEQDEGNQDDDE